MASQDEKEMRDLLVRLDETVKIGFQHMYAKLDEMTRRADGHETRIRSLENWQTEVRGGAKGFFAFGKLGSAVLGALGGLLLAMGLQFAVVDKDKPVTPPATTQQH